MSTAKSSKQTTSRTPCRTLPITAVVGIDLGDKRSTYHVLDLNAQK